MSERRETVTEGLGTGRPGDGLASPQSSLFFRSWERTPGAGWKLVDRTFG